MLSGLLSTMATVLENKNIPEMICGAETYM